MRMNRNALVAAMALVPALTAQSQGSITYLSGLTHPSGGALSVASDAWLAQGFSTGMYSAGYRLDSVELLMANASGTPGGLTVSIYDRNGFFPGDYIGNLAGPADPAVAGVFAYSNPTLALSPATGYFIVVTAAEPLASGSYQWQHVAPGFPLDASGGWSISPIVASTDGSTWTRVGNVNFFQFAVSATPIPEPYSAALFCLGGVWLASRVVRHRPEFEREKQAEDG